jgi:hypothetical protein
MSTHDPLSNPALRGHFINFANPIHAATRARTQAYTDRVMDLVIGGKPPTEVRQALWDILIAQDRDTRHACAEAVCFETARISTDCGKTQVSADAWAIACGSAMERACINVQAI